MADYVYRVVYRVKEDYWPLRQDPAENVWKVWQTSTNGRPYLTATPAKSIATRNNNYYDRYEFKVQSLPADNWTFLC